MVGSLQAFPFAKRGFSGAYSLLVLGCFKEGNLVVIEIFRCGILMCEQMICSLFFFVFTIDANSPGTTTDDDGTGEVRE